MVLLYEVAGRWKVIAAGLGFSEDMIDEIDTNNQTDELCLLQMVEILNKLAPSWETLSLVLRDMGRNDLAHKTRSKGQLLFTHVNCLFKCNKGVGMANQQTSATRNCLVYTCTVIVNPHLHHFYVYITISGQKRIGTGIHMIIHYNCTIGSFLLHSFLLI